MSEEMAPLTGDEERCAESRTDPAAPAASRERDPEPDSDPSPDQAAEPDLSSVVDNSVADPDESEASAELPEPVLESAAATEPETAELAAPESEAVALATSEPEALEPEALEPEALEPEALESEAAELAAPEPEAQVTAPLAEPAPDSEPLPEVVPSGLPDAAEPVAERNPTRTLTRILLPLIGILLLVGVGIVGGRLLLGGEEPTRAAAGDCLTGDGVDDVSGKEKSSLKIVKCDTAAAKYRVIGRIDDRPESEATATSKLCDSYPGTEFIYWEGLPGKKGIALCLAKNKVG